MGGGSDVEEERQEELDILYQPISHLPVCMSISAHLNCIMSPVSVAWKSAWRRYGGGGGRRRNMVEEEATMEAWPSSCGLLHGMIILVYIISAYV